MTRFARTLALMALLAPLPLAAQDSDQNTTDQNTDVEVVIDAATTTLDDWLWIKRPVVVFADSPADPRFQEQVALLTERYAALDDRDVVIITDSDPGARSAVRQALRPRGFSLVVIAKDGTIVTRKPRPWSVREISRSIDKLPLRIDELKGY